MYVPDIFWMILRCFFAPLITGIILFLHFTYPVCFLCQIYVFLNICVFFLEKISVSWSCNLWWQTCRFSLWWIMMSILLLGMVLLVVTCWIHNMVTVESRLVFPNFGTYSYQSSSTSLTPILLLISKGNWTRPHSCLFMYSSFANTDYANIMWSIFSSCFLYTLLCYVLVFIPFVA
jgi:hypothetical protein